MPVAGLQAVLPARARATGAGRLCEADLARLWEGQSFPAAALITRDGRRLRVVYRGRRSAGPGPDFRDAVIAGPGGPLVGDVELHTRSSDFRRHGHHLDPAYDRLVLHLVFHHDAVGDTQLAGGRLVPVVGLADWVEARAGEVRRWLAAPARWQEPCRSALARLGAGRVAETLDRLGDVRFRWKAAVFRRRSRGEETEQLLWEGLLEALAYGGPREAFRRLARRLPWPELRARLAALPPRERAAEARRLLSHALAAEPPVAHRPTRPGNSIGRRLEGAAHLAARFAGSGPGARLLAPLVQDEEPGVTALVRALTVPGLIGRERALEVLANVVLPLAACSPDAATAARAGTAYRSLPLSARYGAVRHLHQAAGGTVAIDSRRQQGMLHLLRRYCSRGGCGKCPLS